MTMRGLLAFAAAMSMAATAQGAEPGELNLGRMTAGYSYYNRPGADMAMHDRDVRACLADASNMRSFEDQLGGGPGGLIGGLLSGALADAANRGVVSASLENCMVVRGWRVVHLDDVEGAALSQLPAADLAAKLAPWVGAETPHGTVVRIWRNDAALAAVNHFSLHAQHTKNGQLSLLATATTVSAALRADQKADAGAKPVKVELDPRWPKKALKPEMLDAAPADAAIIIVNIKGVSMRQGNGFVFYREGPDAQTTASSVDHAPDKISALVAGISASGEGNFRAFVVPAGRWRIFSMFNGGIELNFCLGSPSFEVKAGEVVYAGQLDMKQEKLLPNFAPEAVTTWLAGAKAAARLRPAVYTNGARGTCAPNSIYALEFDGAPFEPGYALGSKVPPLAAR